MQNTLERKVVKYIDFNCDLAQMFGVYKNNSEEDLLDYVSSVNISCGFHAGDPVSIKNALTQAKEHNLVVGAHIGFEDIQGFGNRPMKLSDDEIEAVVLYQVGAIMSIAKSFKMEIEHVRPHGAMYKMAAQDYEFSASIAKAIKKCSQWLVYYGATGENLSKVSEDLNVKVAHEVFLNKIYNADGSLDFDAKDIVNTETSIIRLKQLLSASQVYNNEGGKSYVEADTAHFSSSAPNVIEVLQEANEVIKPMPVNYKNVYASGWVE
ncbi:LamB/YcsF family protein [bacterium]|nr:LamB/YcsF family protein [bacterium]